MNRPVNPYESPKDLAPTASRFPRSLTWYVAGRSASIGLLCAGVIGAKLGLIPQMHAMRRNWSPWVLGVEQFTVDLFGGLLLGSLIVTPVVVAIALRNPKRWFLTAAIDAGGSVALILLMVFGGGAN